MKFLVAQVADQDRNSIVLAEANSAGAERAERKLELRMISEAETEAELDI